MDALVQLKHTLSRIEASVEFRGWGVVELS